MSVDRIADCLASGAVFLEIIGVNSFRAIAATLISKEYVHVC